MAKTSKGGKVPAPSGNPEFAEIELTKIKSYWQPRSTAPSYEQFVTLRDSIKAIGQEEAIIGRPHPTMPGYYQRATGAMRCLVMGSKEWTASDGRKTYGLGLKKILMRVENYTDKQMKIIALSNNNTGAKLPDSDMEMGMHRLWQEEYSQVERKGGKRDPEYAGVAAMERETGYGEDQILRYLRAYDASHSKDTPAEVKEAMQPLSTKDKSEMMTRIKTAPKIVEQVAEARAEKELRSVDLPQMMKTVDAMVAAKVEPQKMAEQVKRVIEAKPENREKVAKEIATEAKRQIESPEERKRTEDREYAERQETDRLTEIKQLEDSTTTKESVDRDVLQSLIKYNNMVESYANDANHQRIVNMSDANKVQAAETVKTIATKWQKFAERFKGM